MHRVRLNEVHMDEKKKKVEMRAKERLICHKGNVNRSIALYVWRGKEREEEEEEEKEQRLVSCKRVRLTF